MKAGVAASDAYLAEWRKADPVSRDGDPEALAEEAALRLETAYGADRLKALIDNDGWA